MIIHTLIDHKKATFILLFLLATQLIYGQIYANKYTSGLQSALGSNTTTLTDIHAIQTNPGAIGDTDASLAILANTEQRYFLSSLNSTFIAGVMQISDHDYAGLSYANFGIKEYQEQKLTGAYSKQIGRATYIGTSVDFYNFRIEEYGSKKDVNINVGLKTQLHPDLDLGIVFSNILPTEEYSTFQNNTALAMGIQYRLSDIAFVVIEGKSDFDHTHYGSLGVNYQILEELEIQAGVNSLEQGFSFGLLYQLMDTFHLSASMRSNQNLGITPSIGLIYRSFNK